MGRLILTNTLIITTYIQQTIDALLCQVFVATHKGQVQT